MGRLCSRCEIRDADSTRFREGRAAVYEAEDRILYADRRRDPGDLFRDGARAVALALTARDPDPFRSECAAYVLCCRYGVEPRGLRPALPERLAAADPRTLLAELGTVRDLAGKMSRGIEARREREARGPERDHAAR